MEKLTDKEIDDFFKLVDEIIPVIGEMLAITRMTVDQLRDIPNKTGERLGEYALQKLEDVTERMCWLYNLNRFCSSLTREEVYNKRDVDSVCIYVRNIIKIGNTYA